MLVDQRVLDPRQAGYDLSIRMGRGPWPGVEATSLMDDKLFPVMSPELWERAGRPCEPEQLADAYWIVLPFGRPQPATAAIVAWLRKIALSRSGT